MEQDSTRILLADDHELVRKGIRALLEAHAGWEVCGEASNGRDAVKLAAQLNPRIAVLDLEMPELNGLEATRQIKKGCPEVEVLIYSMHESEQVIREAIAAGARAYVLKSDAGQHLIEAVEALSRHKPFFTSKASETLLDSFLKSWPENAAPQVLTDREREVVQLLAEGKVNKEVASTLCISVKTVETHRAAIMRKLGINSVVELVHYAVRNNLVKP